jgi:hypothetical protein
MDFPADGTAGGHAYWLSDVRLRDTDGDPPVGVVDVRSHGFGMGDPVPSATTPTAGALPPGNLGVLGHGGRVKTWGPPPRQPVRDRLDITATNVRSVTIDPRRARISCAATLDVRSDGPVNVVLAGCRA